MPSVATCNSITTAEIGNGWQSGIKSDVRFAAMMPASLAVPSTSPFLAVPACDHGQRLRQHCNVDLRRGSPVRDGLVRHVHHHGLPSRIEMGQVHWLADVPNNL